MENELKGDSFLTAEELVEKLRKLINHHAPKSYLLKFLKKKSEQRDSRTKMVENRTGYKNGSKTPVYSIRLLHELQQEAEKFPDRILWFLEEEMRLKLKLGQRENLDDLIDLILTPKKEEWIKQFYDTHNKMKNFYNFYLIYEIAELRKNSGEIQPSDWLNESEICSRLKLRHKPTHSFHYDSPQLFFSLLTDLIEPEFKKANTKVCCHRITGKLEKFYSPAFVEMLEKKKRKPKFSNKKIFEWIACRTEEFEPLLQKIENQTIHPLVETIIFDGPTMTQEKIVFAKKVISLFPEQSLRRNHCKKVSFLPVCWFHEDSTAEAPFITGKRTEAESLLSLPCGMATWMDGERVNIYEQRIELFDFPPEVDEEIAEIYFVYTLAHEFAHTLQKSAYHWKYHAKHTLQKELTESTIPTYQLIIDGVPVDPEQFQEAFLQEALMSTPITTYSGVYKDVVQDIRLHEYMADYITTYVLGFRMDKTAKYPFKPFFDRPQLEKKVKAFLEAEAIIEK